MRTGKGNPSLLLSLRRPQAYGRYQRHFGERTDQMARGSAHWIPLGPGSSVQNVVGWWSAMRRDADTSDEERRHIGNSDNTLPL
jgi:hypothetical protein